MGSKLVFPEDRGQLRGWDSAAVKRDDASDERVVRELVQNALDAAEGSEPIEVGFHLANFKVSDLPHIEDYKNAYDQAVKTLENHPSVTGQQVTDRIDSVLSSDKADCLVCVDDAKGLSGSAIQRLYSEGITDKPTQGRGSVGLGHLTAFAASDLRYVLYAGRHLETGKPSNSFGGHAILATQDTRNPKDKSGNQLSPDGFICDDDRAIDYVSDMVGTTDVPTMIQEYLPRNDTGSVVMLCGYSPLISPPNNLSHADWLLGAIAKNFMVAILQGTLTISFVTSESPKNRCDKDNLEQTLRRLEYQKVHTKHIAGPPGRVACSLWETLKSGSHIELDGELDGTQIWVRPLTVDETRSRVAIFREGMWITDKCPLLINRYFGENAPFSAVVNLPTDPRSNSFTSLVREAEGTSHLEVNLDNITNTRHRERLRHLLGLLQQKLTELAPTNDVERYIPPEFRLFDLPAESRIPTRHIPRAKRKPADFQDAEESEDTTDVQESDDEHPGKGKQSAGTKKKRKIRDRKERPKKGNSAGIRTSAKRVDARSIRIAWSAVEHGFPVGAAGIRIAIPGGSDETSRSTVPSEYLSLNHAEYNGAQLEVNKGSTLEVLIVSPMNEGEAVVVLAEDLPASDTPIIFADIVHRRSLQN